MQPDTEVHNLVKLLAIDLGWTIQYNGDNEEHICLKKGDMRINFRRDMAKRTQMVVSAWDYPSYSYMERGNIRSIEVRPRDLRPSKDVSSINVTIDRPHMTIAADITRRLINPYVYAWELCYTQAQAQQKHHDDAFAKWSAMCTVIGQDPKHDHHYFYPNDEGECARGESIDVTNGYGGNVDIKLRVNSPEQLAAIIELLRKL